jgi:hypothetical protein
LANPDHHHTPEEERRIREAALDETLADTFPASDPPSTIPNPDDDEVLEDRPAPDRADYDQRGPR